MTEASNDFAKMFEESTHSLNTKLYEGAKVTGKIFQITKNNVFVDLGGRSEGVIDIKDVTNAKGEVTVKVGDSITAFCMGLQDGITTLAVKVNARDVDTAVQDAFEAKIPIEGKVFEKRKGGFGVEVGSSKGFCPFSQIDTKSVRDHEDEYVGQTYQFIITEYNAEEGNIVLSRRVLLVEEEKRMRDYMKGMLKEGDVREGKVVKLMPFGAFVDIGGFEGLVPASEIGWTRGIKVEEALTVGQDVNVKIIGLDWGDGDDADAKAEDESSEGENKKKRRRERITLSIKQAMKSPWQRIADGESKYVVGAKFSGKVVRTASYGAFVELEPGLDGLAHISQLGQESRIEKVEDVCNVGDIVEVTILGIDLEHNRISLCFGDPKEKNEKPAELSHAEEVEIVKVNMGEILTGEVEELKPFGVFVKLPNGQTGLLHISQTGIEERGPAGSRELYKRYPLHSQIEVIVKEVSGNKISLTLPEVVERELEKNTINDYKDSTENGNGFGSLDDLFGTLKL